eukprot:m.213983 g.213983  ORF g.213983 m.213983 type:complete len:106 (-) comp15865_c0_seq33:999-1316(-)
MDTDMDLRKLVEKLRMSRNYMVQTTIHDVLQNAQYDLDELQADIAETLDSYVGDNQDQFLTLGLYPQKKNKHEINHNTVFDLKEGKQVKVLYQMLDGVHSIKMRM